MTNIELSPDIQREIDELDSKRNQILETATRKGVEHAVKRQVDEDTFYKACKTFTNFVEKKMRQANILKAQEARRSKLQEQAQAVSTPV